VRVSTFRCPCKYGGLRYGKSTNNCFNVNLISIIQKDIYESTIFSCFNASVLFFATLAHRSSVEHFLN
jgi:hypothetical protein